MNSQPLADRGLGFFSNSAVISDHGTQYADTKDGETLQEGQGETKTETNGGDAC